MAGECNPLSSYNPDLKSQRFGLLIPLMRCDLRSPVRRRTSGIRRPITVALVFCPPTSVTFCLQKLEDSSGSPEANYYWFPALRPPRLWRDLMPTVRWRTPLVSWCQLVLASAGLQPNEFTSDLRVNVSRVVPTHTMLRHGIWDLRRECKQVEEVDNRPTIHTCPLYHMD